MSSRVRLVAISASYGIVKGPNVKRCFMAEWTAKWGKLVIPEYAGMMELLKREPLWRRLVWMASKTNGSWKITAYREPRHTKYKKSRYLAKARELGIEGRKCKPKKMKPSYKWNPYGLPGDDAADRVLPNAPQIQLGNPYGQVEQPPYVHPAQQQIQEFVDRHRQRQAQPGVIQQLDNPWRNGG